MVKKHRVRAHHRPPKPINAWVLAAVCLAAWATQLSPLYRYQTQVSDDGASYVEAARAFASGRGLVTRLHNGLEQRLEEPLTIWPPGYPMLMAGFQTLGLSEPHSWMAATAGCMAVFIILMVWIAATLLPPAAALATALLTVLMPTFLGYTVFIMSDPMYMALATASIACLIVWSQRHDEYRVWRWLLAAGFLAGLSWGVRYVAVALWTATGAWLVAHLLWTSKSRAVRDGIVWGVGVLLGAGPFMLRNLRIAGEINPYHMGPSELSVWDNVRMTLHQILLDVTRWQTAIDWLLRQLPSELIIAVIATLLAWLWIRPGALSVSKAKDEISKHRIPFFLALYALIHIAVLIAARSKYRWGAFIDARVILPVYWVIWIGFAATLLRLVAKLPISKRLAAAFTLAILAGIIGLQLRDQADHVEFLRTTVSGASRDVIPYAFGEPTVQALKQEIGPNQIVLSTRGFVLRIHANLNARQLIPAAKTESLLSREEINQAGEEGLLWGIIIDDQMRAKRGDFGALIQDLANHPERFQEFERVHPESPALILRFKNIRNTPA